MPTSRAFFFSLLLHLLFFIVFGFLLKISIENAQSRIFEIDLSNLSFEEKELVKMPLKEERKPFEKDFSRKREERVVRERPREHEERAPLQAERPKEREELISQSKPSHGVEKREENSAEKILASGSPSRETPLKEASSKEPSGHGPSKAKGGRAEEGERVATPKFREEAEALYLGQKLSVISELMRKNLTYPYLARRMGWQGELILSFIFTPSGEIRDLKIIKSTGHQILDHKAEETLLKVARYFPRPEVEVRIKLPISFKLEN